MLAKLASAIYLLINISWSDDMGINTESNIEANLQIGPTDQGMVRLYIVGNGFEIPMDFEPEEAEEIAEEIQAAIQAARTMSSKKR